MEVEVKLPNQGTVRGMGVRRGLTLIVGGGFHGKPQSFPAPLSRPEDVLNLREAGLPCSPEYT